MDIRGLAGWCRNPAIAAVIFAILIVGAFIQAGYQLIPSSLTAGLHGGTWAQISAELDGRAKARFPIGSPEDKLTSALWWQAFTMDGKSYSPTEHMARRQESNFVCHQSAYIFWRANKGVLVSVRGEYREEGCL